MSTATSLSVRALLNKAIAQTGLTGRRAISGLTLPAKALAVAATAHTSRDAVVLYVVPADPDLEGAIADVRFFLGVLEAMSDAAAEARVLPFPSQQVDPYRGMAPHFRVDLRAGARPACGGARRGPRHRGVGAGAPSPAARRPNRSSPRRSICAAASRSIRWRWPRSSSAAATSARIRSTNTASSRCAAAFSTSSRPEKPRRSASSSSATRSSRSAASIPARSDRSRPSISSRSCRSEEPEDDDGRSVGQHTVFDYLRASKPLRIVLSEPDDVRAQVEKWIEQVGASFEERVADKASPGRERRPPVELMVTWDDLEPRFDTALRLEELAMSDDAPEQQASAPERFTSRPSRRRSSAAASQIGSPTSRQARDRGETILFVASTHGRAERTVELLRDYEIRALPAAPGRRARRGRGARGRRAAVARLPAARRRALQLYAETDIFEEERRRTTTNRKRSLAATFLSDLRDLKVGDYIVHVDNGIGQFVGLKQLSVGVRRRRAGVSRAPLSRRGQAVRPGRTARPGPEIHRRRAAVARSAGRHVLGKGEDQGQESHARHGGGAAQALRRAQAPFRVTRLPRTRTGRRSSKARSSGI